MKKIYSEMLSAIDELEYQMEIYEADMDINYILFMIDSLAHKLHKARVRYGINADFQRCFDGFDSLCTYFGVTVNTNKILGKE